MLLDCPTAPLPLRAAFLILATAACPAVAQQQPVPTPPSPPPDAQQGVDEAGRAPHSGTDGAMPAKPSPAIGEASRQHISHPQLFIRLDQDPVRIAPGESGMLLVLVGMPRGTRVDGAGLVTFDTPQVPVTFGAPVWDAPAQGAKGYTDTIVIRVPVSVGAGTPHQRHMISGKLKATGSFARTEPVMSQEGAADAAALEAAGATPPGAPVADTRTEQPFSGFLVVGPPVPRPTARPPRRQPDTAAGGQSGTQRDPEPTDPAAVRPEAGRATTGTPSVSASSDTTAPARAGETPEDTDPTESGLPIAIIALLGGVVALLAIAIFLRRR